MINTVLFDYDGTLMDTNEVVLQSWQHTFRTFRGHEEDTDTIRKTFGEPLVMTLENTFPEIPLEKSLEVYRSFQRDVFTDYVEVFPGMLELLQQLKNKGCKLGLVTSRTKDTTWAGLESYGMDIYFDAVITAGDTDKHKPDPEPILITLEKLGSAPEESIMVGDTMFDLLCARNAGVKNVMVDWSVTMTDEEKAQADYIIKKADELLDIISEAGSGYHFFGQSAERAVIRRV